MRYANITSIPSSYIVAFFSSLGDASPPGEDAPPNLDDKLQFTHTIRYENKKISLNNKNLSDIFLMYIY